MEDIIITVDEMLQHNNGMGSKSYITQKDLDAIKRNLYFMVMVMSGDDKDMSDIGECEDAINDVFNEWVKENNVVIFE